MVVIVMEEAGREGETKDSSGEILAAIRQSVPFSKGVRRSSQCFSGKKYSDKIWFELPFFRIQTCRRSYLMMSWPGL